MKMRVVITVVIGFLLFSTSSKGQAGIVIQTGLSTAYGKDGNVTKRNQAHYGYVIGADARIIGDDMYFIIGGQYHSTSLKSTSSPKFFGPHDWKVFMGRLGLGFNIKQLNERILLRSKALLSINFVADAPSGALKITGYDKINDSFLGATTGIGVTMGIFDFDLDFQYGLLNVYTGQPNTTFDSWTLVGGIHF